MRPIGIDLFAGAGGLSLGFEQAGFDVAAAVEVDPVHCATHEFNFPESATIPKSVIGLSGAEIREKARLGHQPIDVVFGGAPCQGFSLMGHRVLDDPRNRLVREFVRIVDELEPRYFVFENVKGLTVGRHREFLVELVRAFEDIGYSVLKPWKVLDAANFGVPQHRERLFLLGARKGLPLPRYPLPSTSPGNRMGLSVLPLGPTCADAIGDLPDAERYDVLWRTDETPSDDFGLPGDYARAMRALDNDAWSFGHPRLWSPRVLTSSARTDHSAISRRRFASTPPDAVEPISRFYKLSPNGLSNTLRAGTDAARGAFTSPRPIHYLYPRCVTVREMARLQGFPDWFRFHGTKWHGARQIGNSVPPPLARAVAREVVEVLGGRPKRPTAAIRLGDPELVRLTVSEAAEHYGVPVPIAARNMKSGAKKRKQHEIEANPSWFEDGTFG